jgi:hypothetical protein
VSLATAVLSSFLPAADVVRIPVVALNPGLYKGSKGADPQLKTFVDAKMRNFCDRYGYGGDESERFDFADVGLREYPPAPFKAVHLRLIAAVMVCELRHLCLVDDDNNNLIAARGDGVIGVMIAERKGVAWADLAPARVLAPLVNTIARAEIEQEQELDLPDVEEYDCEDEQPLSLPSPLPTTGNHAVG